MVTMVFLLLEKQKTTIGDGRKIVKFLDSNSFATRGIIKFLEF
jgi:hypothetical protein